MIETLGTRYTMDEIAGMSIDQWRRLRARAGLPDLEPQPESAQPAQAPQAVAQAPAPEPPGIDIASMDMASYARLRPQLGLGQRRQEGVGILNQPASQSWAEAARAKSGRAALNESNVQGPARIEGRTILRHDEHLDHRPARDRFSNASTAFQL
jgi:hypothetical protein